MKVMVALYDRATEAYANPIAVRTRNEAIRSFRDECNQETSPMAKHPSDYELWQIGEFDEQTGELVANKERIARAEDFAQGA